MKTLNFALIGLGKWGRNYERLLREIPGISLQATITSSLGNLKSVLQNPKINCVVIATPPKTHFTLAKAALESGKHVLVEKPMVINLKEAEKLKKVVDNSDKVLMVGFQYLFNDYIRYLKKEIENGSFGKIKNVSSEHFQSPPRKDVNVFWDAAPHPLSIFQFFFNPKKIIKSSFQDSNKNFQAANIQFDRGPILNIRTAWTAPKKVRRLTIVGDKKMAILNETLKENKLMLLKVSGETVIPKIKVEEPLKNEVRHFISCVKSKKVPLTDINFGYQITSWLEKISR